MTWTYDPRTDTWVCGTFESGCGVFKEGGGWSFKAVHTSNGVGRWAAEDYLTREDAMAAAEAVYQKMVELAR